MERDQRREWLEQAIARWEKPILHLCFAYLGDTALAEDAVQETFLKAWRHYDRFRGEAGDKTWLMRIAISDAAALVPGTVPGGDGAGDARSPLDGQLSAEESEDDAAGQPGGMVR